MIIPVARDRLCKLLLNGFRRCRLHGLDWLLFDDISEGRLKRFEVSLVRSVAFKAEFVFQDYRLLSAVRICVESPIRMRLLLSIYALFTNGIRLDIFIDGLRQVYLTLDKSYRE